MAWANTIEPELVINFDFRVLRYPLETSNPLSRREDIGSGVDLESHKVAGLADARIGICDHKRLVQIAVGLAHRRSYRLQQNQKFGSIRTWLMALRR